MRSILWPFVSGVPALLAGRADLLCMSFHSSAWLIQGNRRKPQKWQNPPPPPQYRLTRLLAPGIFLSTMTFHATGPGNLPLPLEETNILSSGSLKSHQVQGGHTLLPVGLEEAASSVPRWQLCHGLFWAESSVNLSTQVYTQIHLPTDLIKLVLKYSGISIIF